ncbi:hypothetical protein ACFQ4L_03020 [Lapidilactobacillus mulanensis]|uniref:Uncharacterized protein n=1 Tax=Lapidilactobacillus mulanensis TaxID=2485999 RepID=A0ABW4DK76_9LACO|nr:hypothetical protein [Lapidilactobacillus mulanensis]
MTMATKIRDVDDFQNLVIDGLKTDYHMEERQALAVFCLERNHIEQYWHQHFANADLDVADLLQQIMADEDDLEDDCRE